LLANESNVKRGVRSSIDDAADKFEDIEDAENVIAGRNHLRLFMKQFAKARVWKCLQL
jgi:hypothetical protein